MRLRGVEPPLAYSAHKALNIVRASLAGLLAGSGYMIVERRRGMNRRPASHEPLVTAREVADRLGVTTAWVYEQSRQGRIPTVTLGRYRRYRLQAIDAWVEALEAPAMRPAAARVRSHAPNGRRPQDGRNSTGGQR